MASNDWTFLHFPAGMSILFWLMIGCYIGHVTFLFFMSEINLHVECCLIHFAASQTCREAERVLFLMATEEKQCAGKNKAKQSPDLVKTAIEIQASPYSRQNFNLSFVTWDNILVYFEKLLQFQQLVDSIFIHMKALIDLVGTRGSHFFERKCIGYHLAREPRASVR